MEEQQTAVVWPHQCGVLRFWVDCLSVCPPLVYILVVLTESDREAIYRVQTSTGLVGEFV